MPPPSPLDVERLVAEFSQLGLEPMGRVMVHASLSALGPVARGPATVVEALRRGAGPEGAVLIPSFRDAIRSDYFALRECEAECPRRLCPSRERGYTGAIGEAVREQEDAVRSCHPTHSWVGVGGGDAYLLEGHHRSLTPCGTDSPFLRLLERNGKVLLLGVGLNAVTNIHVVEDARNVPYLSAIEPRRRHATYTTSGRRLQYLFPQLLDAVLREVGLLRSGRVGVSTSHLIDARDLGSFLWIVTEGDPWCLVVRPRGATYDPFEDACLKVAAMARAWRRNPDRDAWRPRASRVNRFGSNPPPMPVPIVPRTRASSAGDTGVTPTTWGRMRGSTSIPPAHRAWRRAGSAIGTDAKPGRDPGNPRPSPSPTETNRWTVSRWPACR